MTGLHPTETCHLLLRPFELRDAELLHAFESDPDNKEFLGGSSGLNVHQYRSAIAQGNLSHHFAAVEKGTGKFIGRCGFTLNPVEAEGWQIDIALIRPFRRQGLGTEIGNELIRYGLDELKYKTVFGVLKADNVGSKVRCERLGMRFSHKFTINGVRKLAYSLSRNTSPE